MKVWFPVIQVGSGTDVFTQRLAAGLERKGLKTEITWFHPFFELAPFLLTYAAPPPDTDIIHTNSWNAFAFQRRNIPLVVTEHHCVFDPRNFRYRNQAQALYHDYLIKRYVTASLARAKTITTVSEYTADGIRVNGPRQDIRIIPNFIDTELFSPARSLPAQGHRPFRLLFVGNLTRRKGVDLLAPIMRRLGDQFELRFTAGLRARGALAATPNMKPVGRPRTDEEMVQLYRDCDALLFPSRLEGFGLAALEAMACGLPVVASRNSSLPEVIDDNVTGLLCPTDDIEAFVHACRRLAEQPELKQQLGDAGRERAVRLFSEDVVIKQYLELYRHLAGNGAQT